MLCQFAPEARIPISQDEKPPPQVPVRSMPPNPAETSRFSLLAIGKVRETRLLILAWRGGLACTALSFRTLQASLPRKASYNILVPAGIRGILVPKQPVFR